MSSPEPPLSGYGQRGGLMVASVALAAAAVILCARTGPVPVAVPNASPEDVAACVRLVAALPTTLGGQSSRPTTPASTLTAAWGRPAITLACGLTPQAHPVADFEFDVGSGTGGATVAWFQDAFDATLFSTRVRPILQMTVPEGDSPDVVFSEVSAVVLAQRGRG